MKIVEATEFDTANRLVTATKLNDQAKVASIQLMGYETDIVFETDNAYFLRCSLSDIPVQKKTAKGVTAIKLSKDDHLKTFYLLGTEPVDITVNKKPLSLNRLKLSNRAGKGTKH